MSIASPVVRAALWMSGALVSFAAMAISGRELSVELPTVEILFLRSVVGLIVVALLLTRMGWGQVRSHRLGTHLVRNLVHFVGQFGWFFAIALIPLAQVFAIEFTVPIWTAVLATVLLGEQLTRPRVLAIVLGFFGILVILRPGFSIVNVASLAALASALGYAASHVLTRRLALTDSPIAILFYMTVVQLPLGLVPAILVWVWPSPVLWPWVGVVGLTGLSAHYCMARALKLAEATVVVPMDFLRLPLIALVGFSFYGEVLEIWVFIGAAFICAGVYLNVREASSG